MNKEEIIKRVDEKSFDDGNGNFIVEYDDIIGIINDIFSYIKGLKEYDI